MKKIEAFTRHEAFEPIRTELLEKGFPSLSVGQYRGSGRQKGITEHYRGSELTIHLRPKMKLEMVVEDKDVGVVTETILKHARTGEIGDGKIFLIPVEDAGAQAAPVAPLGLDGGVPTLVERRRRVHQKMVDAALVGDGFDRMDELAADEAQRPVAIVVPALDVAVVWPGHHPDALTGLERFAEARVEGRRAGFPDGVDLLVPVVCGDEIVGSVAMLCRPQSAPSEAGEFLHLAATAAATSFA